MTPRQIEAIKRHIRSIYATWHGCALRESELAPADKARGLKAGQLCDDCEAYVAAHVRDIISESKDAA